jgi:hypothetical protein
VTPTPTPSPVLPGLTIQKSLSVPADTIGLGRENWVIAWVIVVRNTGTRTLSDVTVTDTLPQRFFRDVEYARVQRNQRHEEVTCPVNGTSVTCSLYPLEPGEEISIVVRAVPIARGTFINTAVAQVGAGGPRVSATNEVTIPEFGLRLSKVGLSDEQVSRAIGNFGDTGGQQADQIQVGQRVNWFIEVTSIGGWASKIVVTDQVPGNYGNVRVLTNFTGLQWRCSVAGNLVRCTYGTSLYPGQKTHPLVLQAQAGAPGTVTNVASVEGEDTFGTQVSATGRFRQVVTGTTPAGSPMPDIFPPAMPGQPPRTPAPPSQGGGQEPEVVGTVVSAASAAATLMAAGATAVQGGCLGPGCAPVAVILSFCSFLAIKFAVGMLV